MKSISILSVAALAISFSTALAVPVSPEVAKQNLDRIPAADPAVTNAPQLVSSMKGVHPRLLFTAQEIDTLKKQIPTDPVLQNAYDGTIAWAKISLVPSGPKPLIVTDDTSALVKSYSQAPSIAYAYALDHDPAIKQKIIDTLTEMLNQPYWTDGEELDSNMGAACNMMMVALLYDSIYNDLEPAFRSQMAAKILLHARRMYYLGHKGLSVMPLKYWQQDPQNNHRWYGDMGLAACVLVVADEKNLKTDYLLKALKDEMDVIIKWYPPDGVCHEGVGYQSFGYASIAMACEMMDRNLGTDYLKKSDLKNAWAPQLYYWVPGRMSDISWGDDQNGPGTSFDHNDASFFLGPRLSRDKQAQAALLMRLNKTALPDKAGHPPLLPWTMLAFYDPTVGQGDYKSLPTYRLLPDIGSASMRDSWENDAVVFTFKCGPTGGYKLNEYRMATPENGLPHGVNVAHDDPDANEFALAVGNGFAFHPGVYSTTRKTSEHNTLTVDDIGQIGEFPWWTPPLNGADWRQFSYLTGWKSDDKGRVIIEGETGGAYRGKLEKQEKLPEPLLKTYRRTAIWMPKDYILVLDNIVANGMHTIKWHANAPKSQITGSIGTVTTETGTQIGFQVLSNREFQGSVNEKLVLLGRFGNLPVQQLQLTAKTESVKFATLLDPWKTNPQMKLTEDAGVVTLTVHTATHDDTWIWRAAKDLTTPSQISGKRGTASLISLTEADKAPTK